MTSNPNQTTIGQKRLQIFKDVLQYILTILTVLAGISDLALKNQFGVYLVPTILICVSLALFLAMRATIRAITNKFYFWLTRIFMSATLILIIYEGWELYVDLEALDSQIISGFVFDNAGNPIVEASVRIIKPKGNGIDITKGDYYTSTNGHYSIKSSEIIHRNYCLRIVCDTSKPDEFQSVYLFRDYYNKTTDEFKHEISKCKSDK